MLKSYKMFYILSRSYVDQFLKRIVPDLVNKYDSYGAIDNKELIESVRRDIFINIHNSKDFKIAGKKNNAWKKNPLH